jgi:hypothetical protein
MNSDTSKAGCVAMHQTSLNRRRFVGIMTVASCLAALRGWRWMTVSGPLRCFYVAGVRFNEVQALPNPGDTVRLELHQWRGKRCYEVRTQQNERLGYLPGRYVTRFALIESVGWCIAEVRPKGVPWKRYKVSRTAES